VIPWLSSRPVLYAITDRTRLRDRSTSALLDRVRAVVRAGVDAIQIREPDLTDRALTDLVRVAVALGADREVPVLVNDRVDIAVAAGAAGVHLRGDSLPADRVRAMVPTGFVIGRSVHSLAEADAVARAGGCDYLLFGTVYPSVGKRPDHRVAGEAALAEVCRGVSLPVLAIGGVDESRAAAVASAGAAGLAAIGAFMMGNQTALDARVRAMLAAFDSGSRLV
jgi:thiamine-phosphate pyrophosphorylase